MSVKPELTRALAQHAQYREQIAKAVDAGVAAPALAHAKCDASCELGRWLLNPVIGQSGGGEQEHYKEVRSTHQAFHRLAGEVIDAIDARNLEKAKRIYKDELSRSSDELILSLIRWQRAVS